MCVQADLSVEESLNALRYVSVVRGIERSPFSLTDSCLCSVLLPGHMSHVDTLYSMGAAAKPDDAKYDESKYWVSRRHLVARDDC